MYKLHFVIITVNVLLLGPESHLLNRQIRFHLEELAEILAFCPRQ